MRILIPFFFLCASIFSFFKLSAEFYYNSALDAYESTNFKSDILGLYSVELANKIQRASSSYFAGSKGQRLEASYLVELAQAMPAIDEKMKIYCRAFTVLSDIFHKKKSDAILLINWLDLQQITESSACGRKISQDERISLIEKASKNDPTNPAVLYSAGLLSIWSQNLSSAEKLFRDLLRLSTKLSAGQQETILSLIDSPTRFQSIIPARMPQINIWSEKLKSNNPELYSDSISVIQNMQLQAIDSSIKDLSEQKIPAKLHLENLMMMSKTVVNDSVRQAVDENLAITLGPLSEMGAYLRERAKRSVVPAINSVIIYDTLPNRRSFLNWGSQAVVTFDTNSTSLGAFKLKDQDVKIIEIVSTNRSDQITHDSIKLFVSDNNFDWKEQPFTVKQINNQNLVDNIISIEIGNSKFKYLKVNYNSPIRKASIMNRADMMIQLYSAY